MKTIVKNIQILGAALAFVVTGTAASYGQSAFYEDQSTRPPEVTDAYIAMLFNKSTGKGVGEMEASVFPAWAETTIEYQYADATEKLTTRDRIVDRLVQGYNLISKDEPFYVNAVVRISPSPEYNSLFIPNFKQATYFDFEFMDENYAIIPRLIEDRQWIELSPDQFEKFLSDSENAGEGYVQLTLRATAADGENQMNLDGTNYWLIMADIVDMELWNKEGTHKYWDFEDVMEDGTSQLRNLYREGQ